MPTRTSSPQGWPRFALFVALATTSLAVCAQSNPLLAIVAPKKADATAAPAAAEAPVAPAVQTPEASLALRHQTIEAALRADTRVGASERAALEDALARLAVTIRALAATSGRLDAARAREEAVPATEPLAVDATYERWLAQLPTDANAAELWVTLARLGTDVRAMRRQERELVAGALAGALPDDYGDRVLWTPLPLESMAATLPDAPEHAPAVRELARAIEERRGEIVAAVDAARSSPVERIDRLRAARAALAARIALTQRQIEHVSMVLATSVRDSVTRVEAVAGEALARFAPESEAAAHARELHQLAQEIANLHQRDLLFEQRAILHADQLDEIVQLADDTRERLAIEGATNAIGLVLVNDLARTLPPARLGEELAALRRSLADVQIRLVDLRAQILGSRDAFQDLPTQALLERATGETLDASLLASLHLRLLVMVEGASQAVAAAMRGEEAALTELERRNRDLRQLIAGRLLWTRSHAPIDVDWLESLAQRPGMVATVWVPLRDAATKVAARFRGWSGIGALVVAIGAWLALARWQRRRVAALATKGVDGFRTAFATVLCALLLAAPFAWLAVVALRTARGTGSPGSFDDSMLSGVGWSAWTALLLVTVAIAARANGIGAIVLGWNEPTRRALRNTAIGLLLLVLPSQFAVSSAWYRGDLAALQYEARAVFVACWIGIAVVLWRALRPAGAWPDWHGFTRRALRLGLAFAAAAAAVASALGYQITALAIARQLEGTIGVLGTLIVAHGLLLAGISASTRRSAQRRAVQATLARMEGVPDGDVAAPIEASPPDEAHGRRLAGLALTVGGAFWLALLWVGLLPALRQLDDIVLWHVATDAGATPVAISLLDVLSAVGVAVLVVVGLRLVPGLIEAGLRDRMRVEAGTRYAIGALLRYAIAIVGVVMAFGLIGVRWSHLQWMAAALTVGLGFGLQEIFANFVSGLILLFERKVRVGDVVTVGEITGRVTKISTRATTVLDFDRREIMIPNKALITDRLVNWSLTSGLTRTTVRVGVAYGTDPALVHRLLREVAESTDKVLARPAPLTVFTGFGRSNYEFELRAYVASFDDRESVSNELHAAIAAAFSAAGVSMDYEKVDVRVVGQEPEPGVAPHEPRRTTAPTT
ncbi:MAG TPA: mechanosensitive ion channel domain-containing protein [Xanthomonadales bacterium]|nr:mechanosensitive ion channel domain-containing protein [Xanthomonadales bacterium]